MNDLKRNLDEAVIVALGGNRPWRGLEPVQVLEAALTRFPDAGLTLVKRSSWWRSAAWPDPSDPPFINGVALVETSLTPRQVLDALLGIEAEFGRVRGAPNAPRTLDLDLVAYSRLVMEEAGLVLPHPRAMERYFVMAPFAEVAPAWTHPVTRQSAAILAERAPVGRDAEVLAAGPT
jgi:2-amino-4-hydroxy-6-hydroxymethyldihydropteridine diphosphokinase